MIRFEDEQDRQSAVLLFRSITPGWTLELCDPPDLKPVHHALYDFTSKRSTCLPAD